MRAHSNETRLRKQCPITFSLLDAAAAEVIISRLGTDDSNGNLPEALESLVPVHGLPGYLPDLARLELAVQTALDTGGSSFAETHGQLAVNPSLQLIPVSWKNLSAFFDTAPAAKAIPSPVQYDEIIIVWKAPGSESVRIRPASPEDLLALKVVVENLSPEDIAHQSGRTVGSIDRRLREAVETGILLSPPSGIRRTYILDAGGGKKAHEDVAEVFTVQWHITQACDLHCRHCYDRSGRGPITMNQGLAMLNEVRIFCRDRHVRGHITFSGGNPFLHPGFPALYQAAADRGFSLAVLGNPVSREELEKLLSVHEPTHFQVSLEGLRDHNDHIRGQGNFDRVISFLGLLKDLGIYSMVMLTLTQDNLDQVLPLAGILRDRTDLFTFNRLSLVGQGASLRPADRERYERFAEEYLAAAADNPVLGYKDNLLNIVLHRRGHEQFEGCTGYGCGAAFNFVAVLPDGEVHACRKFPSCIGNIFQQRLEEIYSSAAAGGFRSRSSSCLSCPLCSRCGGCLAVTSSHGLDISRDRDPYCFIGKK